MQYEDIGPCPPFPDTLTASGAAEIRAVAIELWRTELLDNWEVMRRWKILKTSRAR